MGLATACAIFKGASSARFANSPGEGGGLKYKMVRMARPTSQGCRCWVVFALFSFFCVDSVVLPPSFAWTEIFALRGAVATLVVVQTEPARWKRRRVDERKVSGGRDTVDLEVIPCGQHIRILT